MAITDMLIVRKSRKDLLVWDTEMWVWSPKICFSDSLSSQHVHKKIYVFEFIIIFWMSTKQAALTSWGINTKMGHSIVVNQVWDSKFNFDMFSSGCPWGLEVCPFSCSAIFPQVYSTHDHFKFSLLNLKQKRFPIAGVYSNQRKQILKWSQDFWHFLLFSFF